MADSQSDAHATPSPVRVWDPVVRLFHWSLVAGFAVAWFTPKSFEALHQGAGYAAATLVALRCIWGLIGTRYARFWQFVRSADRVLGYLRDIAFRREARHIGHNPAGGAMILVLLATMTLTAFTGWLSTTDAYFGIDWVQRFHSLTAHGLLVLVFIHLAGVVLASLRHRENLARAMVTGLKRPPAGNDVA
jgi:cytochrome b